jgi:para-aminobenzoate synthetase / 4-amino-4-deoxychorismate lyase
MVLSEIIKKIIKQEVQAFFYTPPFYEDAASYIFYKPSKQIEISAKKPERIKEVDEEIALGRKGYGYLTYEAGYSYESNLYLYQKNNKIGCFKFFDDDQITTLKSKDIKHSSFDSKQFNFSDLELTVTEEDFIQKIEKIKNYIKEGETYQVNFTVKGVFKFIGDFTEMFSSLIFNQSARYSAFINDGDNLIVSVSPELFFKIDGRKILTKPMKGTIKRGFNISEDKLKLAQLISSEKDKAENVMIVDLLRNDLGKICTPGSIKVTDLFKIEKYESLYQMTSAVEGELKKRVLFSDVIKALFPCGSITGAPKLRTMQFINELESGERGIYTGGIALIDGGKIGMSVPIRTAYVNRSSGEGEIGLGSGIVWDSNPHEEFNETLLKSKFLSSPDQYFELFETILFSSGDYFLLNDHLERLMAAADYFLFRFDKEKVEESLGSLKTLFSNGTDYKVKLVLNKWGEVKAESEILPKSVVNANVMISSDYIYSYDKFRYFKTTNRELYDRELSYYRNKGFWDVLFLNEKNQLAEGAVSNVFIKKGDAYYTPPVETGLLPGVYRKYLLKNLNNVFERVLYKDDILNADEVFLTNSVRKMVKVKKVFFSESRKEYSIDEGGGEENLLDF